MDRHLFTKTLYIIIKIYISIALVAAAVFSTPELSFVPILILAWYLYQWRRPLSAVIDLLTHYFVFFAISAVFSGVVPSFLAPLISLPALGLIIDSLEKTAAKISFRETKRKLSLTGISLTSVSLGLAVLIISLILSSLALIIASAILVILLTVLMAIVHRDFKHKPVEEEQVKQHILSGKEEHVQAKLEVRSKTGGLLFVRPAQTWVKILGGILSLKYAIPLLKMSVTPNLSGPSVIKLDGYVIDRWGLLQTHFKMEPAELFVVPRARYADWIARKYIAGTTRPGTWPAISNIEAIKVTQGMRRGVEYYGNRFYQPGDSLKNIDWKHSSKYNELVTKEFAEFQGRPAVMLVNLSAGNLEEADKLACNIIFTAISLGQENIPAALAAYNRERVVIVNRALSSLQLLVRSLNLARQIVVESNPLKYIGPPEVLRLRANIRRISSSDSQAARILTELLQLEYKNLSDCARLNPCTRALYDVIPASTECNVVIVSQLNHDAEALAYYSYILTQKGNGVIFVR